jgi:oligosaccharyltransferase complex subunit gamma
MAVYLTFLTLSLLGAYSEPSDKNLKADKLRSLSSQHGGVIPFSASDFNEFALAQPRPYTLVVLFTTSSTKYKCDMCEEVLQLYNQVAYSYIEANADYPLASQSGSKARAVFFAVLEYTQPTHSIYQQLGFVSVPNILVTHPRSLTQTSDKIEFPKEDVWELSPNIEIHAYKVIEFVNSRSQRSIELKTSPFEAIMNLVYLLIAIGIVGYGAYALRKLLLLPLVWYVGGIIVYCVCMAGVVYNIIHGVPWIGTNQRGEPEYVNTGQRTQYGLEGLIMSFFISTAGVALVGVNLAAKMNQGIYMRGTSMICVAIFVFCLYKIIGVYRVKATWYNPGMSPPHHYMRGPLIKDQGNSF